jgi:hypothetical protein
MIDIIVHKVKYDRNTKNKINNFIKIIKFDKFYYTIEQALSWIQNKDIIFNRIDINNEYISFFVKSNSYLLNIEYLKNIGKVISYNEYNETIKGVDILENDYIEQRHRAHTQDPP